MNKTIIINIGGTIFHIEEDAYEILKNYMTEVKRSLNSNEDSFEIVTDIENRFAELFSQFLKDQNKQVIVSEDVSTVIKQMGNPSDFNAQEEKEGSKASTVGEQPLSDPNLESRRLFRDPDDKIIGGVCSGISHYFNIDPVWVRLALGFLFFLGGIGLIPYIIFWIAVPVAKTRAERISMKGGIVNFDSIRQSVGKDIKDIAGKANNWRKDNINTATSSRIKGFFEEVFDLLGKLILGIFKLAGVIFGILFLFIGGITLLSFFIAMIVVLTQLHNPVLINSPLGIIPTGDRLGVWFCGFVIILVPFLFIVIGGIKILYKNTKPNLRVIQSLLVIWFIAIGFGTYYFSKISEQFSHKMFASQDVPIKNNLKMTYRLNFDESLFFDSNENKAINPLHITNGGEHRFHFKFGGDYEYDFPNRVSLSIEKSDSGKAYIHERFTAFGATRAEAVNNASRSVYPLIQSDSTIRISNHFSIPEKDGFKFQDARITLFLPLGTLIWINKETQEMVDDLPYSEEDYNYDGKSKDAFIMTDKGLKPKYGVLIPPKDDDEDNSNNSLPKSPSPPPNPPSSPNNL